MRGKEISVIIPIYNAEAKIEYCVRKLLCNNCDFEIILVDDGSKDLSLNVCSQLEKDFKDKVTVIHKENGGVSSARNIGLKYAQGEIITFSDVDDYFCEHALDKIVLKMKSEQLDLLVWNYQVETDKENYSCSMWFDDNKQYWTPQDIKKEYWLFVKNGVVNPVWNKAFNGTIIRNNRIEFNEKITFSEDALFNIDFLKVSNRIGHLDSVLYHYLINEESATHREHLDYYEMLNYVFGQVEAFLGKDNIAIQSQQYYEEWLNVINQTIYHQKYKLLNKEMIQNSMRTKNMIKFYHPINLKQKIQIFFIKVHCLHIYAYLKKWKITIKNLKQ